MKQVKLADGFSLSRVIFGCMRIVESGIAPEDLMKLVHACLDMGVDTFDHAPVYGGYTCETAFGDAVLRRDPSLRSRMKLVTKAGIVTPGRKGNERIYYDARKASILAEMDEAMTKQFQSAFSDIQRYFGEIFVRLFGGGKAELKMLDEKDVLHTGIDILVTLPQKKRQSLAALSGGERALTVIALLFAFLRYRPSPFSVLDEIDAPLDEANVMRFGRFLREFAEQTQFIVVTHRKGTMEVADTMYGVTVEETGVSRLLSVRLDELDTASLEK